MLHDAKTGHVDLGFDFGDRPPVPRPQKVEDAAAGGIADSLEKVVRTPIA
jgi:hypothetical protein